MTNLRNAVSTEATAGASVQDPANPAHRILVVEDDSEIRSFNAEVLSRSGYQVDTAEDGEVAWKALNAVSYDPDSYDLLITDNDMPNVSGVELLRKLRAACLKLPVIMATGTLPASEHLQYPWLKPDVTLLKPYTGEALLSTVSEVLRVTDSPCGQIAQFSHSRSQPLADGWQQLGLPTLE